jgi:oligopeptide/dipeptide ABC transporter ATP-binding protein
MPTIRGRLRKRLPGPIRTARGQLIVLAGYLLITPIFLGLQALTGGLARFRLSPTDLAGSTLGNIVVAAACILAARFLVARSRAGYLFAIGVGAFAVGAGAWAIARIVNGQSGLAGDPAFYAVVYQAVYVVIGAAIVINLLRAFRRAYQLASENVTTGHGLRVPLRDIRIRPGKTVAPPPAIETVEGPGDASAELIAAPEATHAAVRDTREPLLAVRGLKKHFPIYGGLLRRQIGTVFAVDGVDFDVFPGEIFSLVGESGCGKTTLGRSVLQLTPPTAGRVVFDGYELSDVDPDDMRPLRRRMQIIFQDPFGSLNPRMPVSDIIGEGLLAQGVKDRKTRDKRVEDSLEIVGLRRDYTRRYPHEFSGGQRQRIGIARALALGPDLVVCDEPVSALDVSIQSQVLNLLLDLRRDFNLTYLFISHNLSVVQYFSDRVGVMYLGKLVEEGAVEQLYRDPRHPYTVALLSAIPNADPRRRRKRLVLKGDVPSPAAPPSGCRFHTRCWLREKLGNPERCATEEPALRPIDEAGHRTACHYAEEVSDQAVEQVVATQSVLETAVADPV